MIDVKIIKKPKNKATTPTLRTPGAAYGDKSVKEAVHASKADMAKMAEKASLAEQAEHARKADEATRADEANHALAANEANHAKTADEVNLESETLSHFLRKDIADTAVEVLTFLKGIVAKGMSYFKGIFNDGDITNSGTITTKNLNVTGKATFFELEIQKAKAAGGMTIYSPGAFHIDEVVDTGNYYACYQRAEQDGVKLMQKCEVGDQLMCARFNVGGNGNKFYWMRVAYASPNTVQRSVDGKLVEYLEVRLDKSVKADNCQGVPEVGDALAVVGNRRKEERQSVIVISAYNSLDINLHAPYIAQYENVNDFDLESKKTTWLSKGDNNLTGSFTVVSGGKKVSLDDFVTKISQATFKVEADKITATVARKSDLEDLRTEIKQTAEEINLSVSNGTRPNLLWGSDLNLDGVDTTNKAAIENHLGVGLGEIKVDDAEYFKYLKGGGVAGSDAVMFKSKDGVARWTFLRWEKIKVKPNTVYTMSAWVKFKPNKANVNIIYVGVNETVSTQPLAFKEGSDNQYYLAEIKDWERRHWTFTTKEETLITVLFAHSGTDESLMWLCRPKLEEGNTATPWCAYDGTEAALLATGLDIKNRKMMFTTDNFIIRNNNGETTVTVDRNGMFQLYGKDKIYPGIRFGVNEVGEMVLEFWRGNKKMYDLGPDNVFDKLDRVESYFEEADLRHVVVYTSYGEKFIRRDIGENVYILREGYKMIGNVRQYDVSGGQHPSAYDGKIFTKTVSPINSFTMVNLPTVTGKYVHLFDAMAIDDMEKASKEGQITEQRNIQVISVQDGVALPRNAVIEGDGGMVKIHFDSYKIPDEL